MHIQSTPWQSRIVGHDNVAPSELTPHPSNFRTHPLLQRDALSAALGDVGWVTSVIVNRSTGYLLDGHLRVALAKERGEPTIPVAYVELSVDEERLVLATLDPLSALAGTDPEPLTALLAQLQATDDALEALFARLAADAGSTPTASLADPDDVPSPPRVIVSRPGDTWRLGNHRLLCGDATDQDSVKDLFAGERARWMWTDPPYGVDYHGKTDAALSMTNDTHAALTPLLRGAFGAADTILAPHAAIYVAHPAGALAAVFIDEFRAVGWQVHQGLVWVKDAFVLGHSDYHYRHEPILYGGKGGRPRWYGRRSADSVFQVPRPRRSDDHPTAKPVDLVRQQLMCSSRRGQVGFDPFVGSGTTIVAAETSGRRCFGIEIDPRYVDAAIQRFEALTGAPAVLDGDGRRFAEIAEQRHGG